MAPDVGAFIMLHTMIGKPYIPTDKLEINEEGQVVLYSTLHGHG